MTPTEELFTAVTRLTGDGLCLCEMIVDAEGKPVDYRFLEVNEKFEAFTGLKDARGRTALELVPALEQHWIETYARVGLGRETLRLGNGSVPMGRWFEVHASPVEPHGRFMILFRDVSERKSAEEAREKALEKTRRLFDELSHRVKNSLAVVNSIIPTEARGAPEAAGPALERISMRVAAIGKLYEAMSVSGWIDEVEAQPYLGGIVEGLETALVDGRDIRIGAEIDALALSGGQAISLGLIVNELVTNSVKHGFPDGQRGAVRVRLRREVDQACLTVEDDGIGAATGQADDSDFGGLGSRLVQAFVADLDGEMHRAGAARGMRTEVRFPLVTYEAATAAGRDVNGADTSAPVPKPNGRDAAQP